MSRIISGRRNRRNFRNAVVRTHYKNLYSLNSRGGKQL